MRYTEQLKISWSYHWGLFREVWDMFTLHNWRWLIVGLLVGFCVVPLLVAEFTPVIGYFVKTPIPPFDPTLPGDIIAPYFFRVPEPPSLWAVMNYHWVGGNGFQPLVMTLCLMSMGLLLVAHLRVAR